MSEINEIPVTNHITNASNEHLIILLPTDAMPIVQITRGITLIKYRNVFSMSLIENKEKNKHNPLSEFCIVAHGLSLGVIFHTVRSRTLKIPAGVNSFTGKLLFHSSSSWRNKWMQHVIYILIWLQFTFQWEQLSRTKTKLSKSGWWHSFGCKWLGIACCLREHIHWYIFGRCSFFVGR